MHFGHPTYPDSTRRSLQILDLTSTHIHKHEFNPHVQTAGFAKKQGCQIYHPPPKKKCQGSKETKKDQDGGMEVPAISGFWWLAGTHAGRT